MKSIIPKECLKSSNALLLNESNKIDISYVNCETNYISPGENTFVCGNLLSDAYANCCWCGDIKIQYITVDPNSGNDSTGNLSSPFKTIPAALKFIANFSNREAFQINLAAGTYPALTISAEKEYKSIMFNGTTDGVKPLTVINGLECSRSSVYSFYNVNFTGKNQYNQTVTSTTGACLNLFNCVIDADSGAIPLCVADHGICGLYGDNIQINGSNCNSLIYALRHGNIMTSVKNPIQLNGINNSVTVTSGACSVCEFGNQQFTGQSSGYRYYLYASSLINVGGRGPNVLPGNSVLELDPTCSYS